MGKAGKRVFAMKFPTPTTFVVASVAVDMSNARTMSTLHNGSTKFIAAVHAKKAWGHVRIGTWGLGDGIFGDEHLGTSN